MSSEDDENDMLDSSSTSSLLLPTINDKNLVNNADFKENFLRLSSMVRRAYFSYLHKSLLSNYVISCPTKNVQDFDSRIKNCATQMELFAVRSALETSLYRKAMSKLISQVKEHTNEQKLHKTLTSFLISAPEKSDMAVQTDQVETLKTENIITFSQSTNSIDLENNLIANSLDPTVTVKIEPLNDLNFAAEPSNLKIGTELPSNDLRFIDKIPSNNFKGGTEPSFNDFNPATELPIDLHIATQETTSDKSISNLKPDLSLQSLFEKSEQNFLDESAKLKAEDSQDSLFQTMEDMFCESDDSSDLMTLIEKHSSTQSENPVLKSTPKTPKVVNNFENKLEPRGNKRKRNSRMNSVKFKRRNSRSSPVGFNELKSPKYMKKVNEIWLVERVYQTSKLKSTMLEISLLDYRKYGRIKAKFAELFGESDSEDVMPESPVCIEDHLRACKERIAPWIVKHLTPFYSQKRISSRELFKTVCRHITDMLIINDTFPEETSVKNYVQDFFKNKMSIKTEADIYL